MKISVVVPAFNEERLLGETLRRLRIALESISRVGWDSELIVCDNNSTDRTAELAREAGATVVFEPVNQIARSRNSGAAAATGDWLVFVDADSHASPELFAEVAREIASGTCLAGGSVVELDEQYAVGSRVVGLWNWLSRTFTWLAGSFIFCETKAFRAVGGFSLELFAAEELELTKKLKALAREERKRIVILDRHPLRTSARKMRLYSTKEQTLFLLRTIFTWGRTLNKREACHQWYDGRR